MSNPQQEPTMEEILASIRKIISEDSDQPAVDAAKPPPDDGTSTWAAEAQAPSQPESEILELTEVVSETETSSTEPPPAPLELREEDVVSESVEETDAMHDVTQDQSSEGIFTERTRKAVEDTFAEIPSDLSAPPAYVGSPVAPVNGRTVEELFEKAIRESFDPAMMEWLDANRDAVIDRMKPVIRDWMDEHFPALLEGAVRNEVARVIKARGHR